MEREIHTVNLGSLGDLVDGRAQRQFDAAFRAVVEGVTDPEAARSDGVAKGTITVKITVDGTSIDDGGRVSMSVEIDAKPPKARSSGTTLIHIGGGEYGMDLTDPQQRIFPTPLKNSQE